jgi:hypothetical protein
MQISRNTLWGAALLAAAIGTYILYEANPGVNWGIWVTATAAGLLFVRSSAAKPIRKHTLGLLAWAVVLAWAASITVVDGHAPLIVATVAILLGLTVLTLDDFAEGISLPTVAQVPFAAVSRVARQSATEIMALPRNVGGLRGRPALRGLIIAVPVALLLIALLSKADPVLDSVRDSLLGWMDNWTIDGRAILFPILGFITLGAYGLASGPAQQLAPTAPDKPVNGGLGNTESRLILGTVNAVLWLFVVLQVFSFTRNPGGTTGTGLTYAEYARRGFAEMSVAAAIVLGVILLVEVFRKAEIPSQKRTLELTAILAVELVLASAFRRVLLYEAAYGYTTDRLIAQTYMIVLGAAFLFLAWDLSRGAVSRAFGRKGMMLTLAAITVFTYWNYEAWIVGENLERSRSGAELDIQYLTTLSPAAIPALVDGRSQLNATDRAALDARLACTTIPEPKAWYEWNYRMEKARQSLATFAGKCPPGAKVVRVNRGP